MTTERVHRVTPITAAHRGRAAQRALSGAAAKVRITPGQRRAIVTSARRKSR